jgi:hypothetical protein
MVGVCDLWTSAIRWSGVDVQSRSKLRAAHIRRLRQHRPLPSDVLPIVEIASTRSRNGFNGDHHVGDLTRASPAVPDDWRCCS